MLDGSWISAKSRSACTAITILLQKYIYYIKAHRDVFCIFNATADLVYGMPYTVYILLRTQTQKQKYSREDAVRVSVRVRVCSKDSELYGQIHCERVRERYWERCEFYFFAFPPVERKWLSHGRPRVYIHAPTIYFIYNITYSAVCYILWWYTTSYLPNLPNLLRGACGHLYSIILYPVRADQVLRLLYPQYTFCAL